MSWGDRLDRGNLELQRLREAGSRGE